MSLMDQANGNKLVPKKEKPISIKLKKAIVKKSEPKEGDGNEPKTGGTTRSPTPGSPSIPESELGKPIDDRPDYLQCKHCKKPTPKISAISHVKLCEEKKKEKARRKKEAKEARAALAKEKERAEKEKEREMNGESATAEANGTGKPDDEGDEPSATQEGTIKTGKKSAGKASTDGPKQTKKRKADAEGDKEPKKKKLKKDEPPKPKMPKPKGPVDVEKQCGVQLPNGGNCARSLTCKSHSMGAKRAVPGRSMPYDQLLAAYQKKNQAKQQKMALDNLAPLADDIEPTGPVDSDKEAEDVAAGVARSRLLARPMAQHVHYDLKRHHERIRIKQMMAEAMPGKDGRGLFAIGDHGSTNWNGGAADRSAAALGSGSLGTSVMANINSGMHDDFEISQRSNEVGSAHWHFQQAAQAMAAEDKANEESRKKGGQAQEARMSTMGNGSRIVHIDQN